MSKTRTIFGSRRVVRFAFAGMAAASLAGCADSDRFSSNPLGNPFSTASADRPDSPDMSNRDMPNRDMPNRDMPMRGAPTGSISSRPLPPPVQTSSLPVHQDRYANYAVPAHESPRLAEAVVPSRSETTTASIATGHGSWSPDGGMPVIAAQGDTARMLGERYNVPTDALLHANGFSSAAQIRPGTRVIIPVYSATSAPEHSKQIAAKEGPARHDHASREKLLARHEAKPEPMRFVKGPQPAPAKVAEAEHGRAKAMKKMAQGKEIAAKPAMAKLEPAKKVVTAKVLPPIQPIHVAKLETPEVKKPAPPVVDPTPTASLPPPSAVAAGPANPEFRWPARGRIIQGFKSGGNDGINIAVPEGTAVKAAESGVVAYAGSEIKGFGNLVLIRHPNGYVSAYANNGALNVKRGEQVKRGQTIATSGQSGNVASPQLHFELRKGSTPVDPTQYLAGL